MGAREPRQGFEQKRDVVPLAAKWRRVQEERGRERLGGEGGLACGDGEQADGGGVGSRGDWRLSMGWGPGHSHLLAPGVGLGGGILQAGTS